MCSNNFNFANPSSSNTQQSTPPLSTTLPSITLGSNSQPGLTAPLLPSSSSSSSAAPLMPADAGSGSTTLTGSAPSAVTAIAPATPTPPPVIAIVQPLPPGTYDVTVSASPSPAPVVAPVPVPPVAIDPMPPVAAVPIPDVVPTPAPAPTPAPVPVVAAAPLPPVPTIPAPAPLPPAPAPAVVAIPEIVQQVLTLTNQFRAGNGLAPLNLNIELDAAALVHSQDMAVNQYFSHTGLNGSTAISRVNQVGYSAMYYGENIAAGYDTAQEVVQGWIDSPEHRANLLNPSFTEVGIGYYYLPNDVNSYFSYWTQNFGSGDLNPATYV